MMLVMCDLFKYISLTGVFLFIFIIWTQFKEITFVSVFTRENHIQIFFLFRFDYLFNNYVIYDLHKIKLMFTFQTIHTIFWSILKKKVQTISNYVPNIPYQNHKASWQTYWVDIRHVEEIIITNCLFTNYKTSWLTLVLLFQTHLILSRSQVADYGYLSPTVPLPMSEHDYALKQL